METQPEKLEGHGIDSEHLSERVKDLFLLDEAEQEILSKRIVENEGRIRVFVHPFFDIFTRQGKGPMWEKEASQVTDRSEAIKDVLAKLITNPATPPLFIMEETTMFEALQQEIATRLETPVQHDFYLIPTVPESSTPLRRAEKYPPKEDKDKAWKDLVGLFTKLGVREILLAGMYLRVRKHESSSGEIFNVSACVGDTFMELYEQFKVEMSALTYPQSRIDMNQIKFDGEDRSELLK